MNIEGEGYTVEYNADDTAVVFEGTLRLNGVDEYAPILELLNEALGNASNALSVDLRLLKLLNSSGISMMSKFVIGCRGKDAKVKMLASANVPWQEKSLKNLQRLMPSLELEVS